MVSSVLNVVFRWDRNQRSTGAPYLYACSPQRGFLSDTRGRFVTIYRRLPELFSQSTVTPRLDF